jgi:hypothetical protein
MYSDYRFLAKGVAQDDRKFNKLEAQTWQLASRNKEYYELCFLSRPYTPKGDNEIKFLQDDVFMDMKTVTVLNPSMPGYNKYKKAIDAFLKKNPTPTLAEFRKLNQELIAEQEMVNYAESQIGMG